LWSVNGQTMSGITGRSFSATVALTPPAEDPSFSRYRTQSAVTGQFSIDNVVPGSYIVTTKGRAGDQELTAFRRIVLRPELVKDEYHISLPLNPPLNLSGRIFADSREGADLHQATIALVSVDPDLPSPPFASVRQD